MTILASLLLFPLQSSTLRTVWVKSASPSSTCQIAVSDEHVFILGYEGNLSMLNLQKGNVIASRALSKIANSVATSGDAVYVVSDKNLHRLKVPSLEPVWKGNQSIDFPEVGTALAVGPDGTIAVKRLRGISFYSASEGKSVSKLWTAGFGSPISVPLYLPSGVLFMSGAMTLFDNKNEKPIWTAKVGQAVMYQTPFYDGESIYVGSKDGLFRVNPKDGKIEWQESKGGAGSPTVCGDVVVVHGGGGFSGYEKATGKKKWTVDRLAVISGALRINDEMVAVMYYRGSSIRIGVFDATNGELLQESNQVATYRVSTPTQLFFTKNRTIVGQYGSTVFCLASGV